MDSNKVAAELVKLAKTLTAVSKEEYFAVPNKYGIDIYKGFKMKPEEEKAELMPESGSRYKGLIMEAAAAEPDYRQFGVSVRKGISIMWVIDGRFKKITKAKYDKIYKVMFELKNKYNADTDKLLNKMQKKLKSLA